MCLGIHQHHDYLLDREERSVLANECFYNIGPWTELDQVGLDAYGWFWLFVWIENWRAASREASDVVVDAAMLVVAAEHDPEVF